MDVWNRSFIDEANTVFQLPRPVVEAFYAELERIAEDPGLQSLALELSNQLHGSGGNKREAIARLREMGPEAGMFAAVVYASGLPAIKEHYISRGIPQYILKDTMSDLGIWMHHHKQLHGAWGLSELGWLVHHFSGSIYKLGRLQFMPKTYNVKAKAFRNRTNGRILALTDAGVTFRSDGQVNGTNGIYEKEGAWVSHYRNDGHLIYGNRISPEGCAVRESVVLDGREWELVLQEGDPVLDVHIPAAGKMSHDLCRESYRQAVSFAAEFIPGAPIKAIMCSSWLLSPQLGRILPPSSNIVTFMKDYFLTPVLSDDVQTFDRVFGAKPDDLSQAPRDTTLRRTVLDYVMAGHAIHGGAGFFLPELVTDERYADRTG
ncbi:acyltransferase domain-containing protein [Paenibacillus sp. MBLB4367]|uniref:acyltransferase domain-containing protein n=1 Tax=Paenibacillus sp. MBLB4367 TaxID=3384767 RepID=UPI00390830F5